MGPRSSSLQRLRRRRGELLLQVGSAGFSTTTALAPLPSTTKAHWSLVLEGYMGTETSPVSAMATSHSTHSTRVWQSMATRARGKPSAHEPARSPELAGPPGARSGSAGITPAEMEREHRQTPRPGCADCVCASASGSAAPPSRIGMGMEPVSACQPADGKEQRRAIVGRAKPPSSRDCDALTPKEVARRVVRSERRFVISRP